MSSSEVGGSHLKILVSKILGTTNVLQVQTEPSELSLLDSPIPQHHSMKAKGKQPVTLFKISQGQQVTQ